MMCRFILHLWLLIHFCKATGKFLNYECPLSFQKVVTAEKNDSQVAETLTASADEYSSPHKLNRTTTKHHEESFTNHISTLNIETLVGGTDAMSGSFPWQGRLFFNKKRICAVAIVSDFWVATAAHCLFNIKNSGPAMYRQHHKDVYRRGELLDIGKMLVVVGDVSRTIVEGGEQYLYVSEVVVHPLFKRFDALRYDFALIRIRSHWKKQLPIQFTRFVRPACIMTPGKEPVGESGKKTSQNQTCFVSGWGSTDKSGSRSPEVLQWEEKKLVIGNKCVNGLKKYVRNERMDGSMVNVCVGPSPSRTAALCHGDGGSPLVCYPGRGGASEGVVHYLVGVASYITVGGAFACTANKSFLFTRVSRFQRWIRHTLENSETSGAGSVSFSLVDVVVGVKGLPRGSLMFGFDVLVMVVLVVGFCIE